MLQSRGQQFGSTPIFTRLVDMVAWIWSWLNHFEVGSWGSLLPWHFAAHFFTRLSAADRQPKSLDLSENGACSIDLPYSYENECKMSVNHRFLEVFYGIPHFGAKFQIALLSGWNTLREGLHPLRALITCSPQQKVIDTRNESRQVSHEVWQLQCRAGAGSFQGSLLGKCLATVTNSTIHLAALVWAGMLVRSQQSIGIYWVYFKSESFWRPLLLHTFTISNYELGGHSLSKQISAVPRPATWESLGQRRPRSHPERMTDRVMATIGTMDANQRGMR